MHSIGRGERFGSGELFRLFGRRELFGFMPLDLYSIAGLAGHRGVGRCPGIPRRLLHLGAEHLFIVRDHKGFILKLLCVRPFCGVLLWVGQSELVILQNSRFPSRLLQSTVTFKTSVQLQGP